MDKRKMHQLAHLSSCFEIATHKRHKRRIWFNQVDAGQICQKDALNSDSCNQSVLDCDMLPHMKFYIFLQRRFFGVRLKGIRNMCCGDAENTTSMRIFFALGGNHPTRAESVGCVSRGQSLVLGCEKSRVSRGRIKFPILFHWITNQKISDSNKSKQ